MNVLIATPLYPPDIGGPAKYAKALHEEYARTGRGGGVVAYGRLEKMLPPLLRHAVYFFRLLPRALRSDAILALDTWSVGVPALCAALLLRKKLIVRIGGDFLWETYVERTGKLIKLSQFYRSMPQFSLKERLIRRGTAFLLRNAGAIAFTTQFQRNLWLDAYDFDATRAHIVGNEYPESISAPLSSNRTFVAAGRELKLKNMTLLKRVFGDVQRIHPDVSLDTRLLPPAEHAERIARCYAVVVPSVSEVNANAAIEAAALRKPFLAPSDGGTSERLAGAGLFIDTQDAAALREALEKLLDPALYAQLASAPKYAHSLSDIAREYAALVER